MSTVDTSTWNPDPALNESIGDIPLNESASIRQTWQAIQMLMAAGGLHGLQLVPFSGATASEDGASGLVPAPEAGDQDKALKGDGTWGTVAAASHSHGSITSDGKLGTVSRAVVTDGNKAIGVSSVTATELGYLSGVTSAVQTQINAKAANSDVVHLDGTETVTGGKTVTGSLSIQGGVAGISKDGVVESANDLFVKKAGVKQTYFTTANSYTKLTDIPYAENTFLESFTIRYMSSSDFCVHQMLHNLHGFYFRSCTNGTWGSWKAL